MISEDISSNITSESKARKVEPWRGNVGSQGVRSLVGMVASVETHGGETPPSARCNARKLASPCFPPASPVMLEGAGKQKTPRRASAKSLILLKFSGAGEGIRTLDPNLGKQKITLSRYSSGILQISFQYARGRVLPVFVGMATYGRNDTPMSWREPQRNCETVTAQ